MICLCLMAIGASAQYRSIPNTAFDRGEKMTFRVAFNSALTGNITAGKAVLEVKNENKLINGRSTYHIVGEGYTTGIIEMFYQINDRLETYMDEEGLFAWQFVRRTRENNYKKDETVTFRQGDKLAVSLTKIVKAPAYVQDMVSSYFYARTLDISNLAVGQSFTVPFFLDDSVYQSKVVYRGKQTVKTKMGTFSCLMLSPMVATGYAFDDPYPISVFVTDDNRRVPVLIESKLSVGKARIELIDYSGNLPCLQAGKRNRKTAP